MLDCLYGSRTWYVALRCCAEARTNNIDFQKIAREQLSEIGLSTSILDTLLFLIEQAGQKGSMLDSDICVARFWQGM